MFCLVYEMKEVTRTRKSFLRKLSLFVTNIVCGVKLIINLVTLGPEGKKDERNGIHPKKF